MKLKPIFMKILLILLVLWGSVCDGQIVTTIAGSTVAGFSGDGGAASAALFYTPYGLAIDKHGNLYVEDDNRIRKINTSGIISTIAGNGTATYGGNGTLATSSGFGSLYNIAIDSTGNIFVVDNSLGIRKIDTSGIVNNYAGTGINGFTSDGIPATSSRLNVPWTCATDKFGNLFIADQFNHRIRKVNAAGIITTFAGTGIPGYSGDGGPASNAQLSTPVVAAFDKQGNLLISDSAGRFIRKVDTSGIITTIAGNGHPSFAGDGGPATVAQFAVSSICVNTLGVIYICDEYNFRIRKINKHGIITTVAGNGVSAYSGDGGPATAAELTAPYCLTIDSIGNVYFTGDQNVVRKISGNHIPFFLSGDSLVLHACMNDVDSMIDSALMISDADTGQDLHLILLSGPNHGTASINYNAISTGAGLLPIGLSYTPVIGFSGIDTFTVRVDDEINSSTATVYVNVNPCTTGFSNTSGPSDIGLHIFPNPNTGMFYCILNSPSKEEVVFRITDILGRNFMESKGTSNNQLEFHIPLEHGIYYLSAISEKGVWSTMVIKQ